MSIEELRSQIAKIPQTELAVFCCPRCAENLVCWWSEKPTLDQLCNALEMGSFPPNTDAAILNVVAVWQGGERRIGNTDYRLASVHEGRLLK